MKHARLALMSFAMLSVVGCATATPYQAAATQRYGYEESAVEAGRYRVSFAGNALTDRKTVENYLLFRAAELTLREGFDTFIIADRKTDKKTETTFLGGYSEFQFGLNYHFYNPRYGGRFAGLYDPLGHRGDWFGAGSGQTIESSQFEASAEITLVRGEKPADNAMAYDARSIVSTLGPNIKLPGSKP